MSLYDANGEEVYERVALLLRHPFHCFTSHYFGRRGFDFKKGLKHFEAYAANINQFERLKKAKKEVFYFENFVNDEQGTLAFLRFFNIDVSARPYSFRQMTDASRSWYRSYHGLLAEDERPQLKNTERAAICRMLHRRLGENFARYLACYSLDD